MPRPSAVLTAAVATIVVILGGCSAATTDQSAPSPTTNANDESPALSAIRAAIDEINATAGGPVEAQRAVLDQLAAPEEEPRQQHCPAATTTLAFDPAYRDLRQADSPDAYLLPTYITIYSGERIIGSDLANLRLWIVDGVARTSALCVS